MRKKRVVNMGAPAYEQAAEKSLRTSLNSTRPNGARVAEPLSAVHGGVVDVDAGTGRQGEDAGDRDDRGEDDVRRDRVRCSGFVQQPRRDQWRGATGENRGQLIAQSGAAVAQVCWETLADQRGLWAVLQRVCE